MRIEDARALFVGLKDKVFLDAACVSLAPLSTKTEVMKFIDMTLHCDQLDASAHHIAMDNWRQEAANEAALLFKAPREQVALIESTTHGLNIAANAIPWERGDEVIIADTEFLQVAIPFCKKEEQGLLKVVALETSPEGFSLDSLIKKITPRTKAVCISSVQWCTGERLPMKDLGELCRERGIWLIIDGVQEAGALDVDLSTRPCDFYIAGGHKWLNAPYGCGVMVFSKRALELKPSGYGYLSLAAPSGGWGSYFQNPDQTPFRKYEFARAAQSFETSGTSNYPGAIALGESIKILNAIGSKKVEEHVLHLARFLRQELQKLKVQIVSPELEASHSGITMFRVSANAKDQVALLDRLLEKRIFLSVRYTANRGGIRASTHYFNNEEDILRLIIALKNEL